MPDYIECSWCGAREHEPHLPMCGQGPALTRESFKSTPPKPAQKKRSPSGAAGGAKVAGRA